MEKTGCTVLELISAHTAEGDSSLPSDPSVFTEFLVTHSHRVRPHNKGGSPVQLGCGRDRDLVERGCDTCPQTGQVWQDNTTHYACSKHCSVYTSSQLCDPSKTIAGQRYTTMATLPLKKKHVASTRRQLCLVIRYFTISSWPLKKFIYIYYNTSYLSRQQLQLLLHTFVPARERPYAAVCSNLSANEWQ